MLVSSIDQEVSDFDWFAVDCAGYLVHFASGGGRLPSSIAASIEKLDLLCDYFSSLPILYTEAELFPSLAKTAVPYSNFYTEYACRGLASYDKLLTNWTTYELIALPPRILLITDIRPEIAKLVLQTRLPFSVADSSIVDTMTVV